MLSVLALLFGLAGAPAPVVAAAAETCDVATPDCRFVPDYKLVISLGVPGVTGTRSTVVHASKTVPFVRSDKGKTTLTLFPGEIVLVRLGSAGEPEMAVVDKDRTDASQLYWTEAKFAEEAHHLFELMARDGRIRESAEGRPHISDLSIVLPAPKPGDPPREPAPANDTIRITFKQLEGTTAMFLLVQDGYGRALSYHARGFYVDGRWLDFGSCLVSAHEGRGESYLFTVAEIELSDLKVTTEDPDAHNCPMFREIHTFHPSTIKNSPYAK